MTSSHSNTVRINDPSNSIASIAYVENSLQISPGQPSTVPPSIDFSSSSYAITLQAGRHKTSDMASTFNFWSGGLGHEYAPSAGGGGKPNELNFWFSVAIQFQTGATVTINLGQGSISIENNWWIGGSNIQNQTSPQLVYTYEDFQYTFTMSGDQDTFNLNFSTKSPVSPIEYVFVLMLENHSFDNMLAMSNIPGLNVATPNDFNIYGQTQYNVGGNAPTSMPTDPGHEFTDVVTQLCGPGVSFVSSQPYPPINNSGFAYNYATTTTEGPTPSAADIGDIMLGINTQSKLPVLFKAATQYVVCDNWFSSMPGPTWPNRFFLHGASSNGLDHSPSNTEMIDLVFRLGTDGFVYPNGSIFERLSNYNVSWKLYHDRTGDVAGQIPQVAALQGVSLWDVEDVENFPADLLSGAYSYQYTFIEPSYGNTVGGTYEGGTSQHPMDGVAMGEALIATVYKAIRASPLWEKSVLIVTYDEHGGFYDHVPPGSAANPNDGGNNSGWNEYGFDFTQYGVRVPALIISPLIQQGVDHTVYDHASVLATLEWLFGVPALTARDASANVIQGVQLASSLRTDTPTELPAPSPPPPRPALSPEAQAASDAEPVPDRSTLTGLLGVLLKAECELAQTPEAKAAAVARFQSVRTRGEARAYAEEVIAKARAKEAIEHPERRIR